MILWLVGAVVCDVTITGVLTWFLVREIFTMQRAVGLSRRMAAQKSYSIYSDSRAYLADDAMCAILLL